ncbi:MAG: FAD-dependent oxidoreductase, partial [Desulfarculus sp.]|nr:FAD-dependent oxidoreductase [Desulfarculus sp.]
CPAGIDIPSFIALVGHGRHAEALSVIRQDNPLPYICGLVCPAPCEIGCLRGDLDQPIAIRVMKAVAAAGALAAGGYPKPALDPPSGRRVAVIGAGPAGLACAWFAALKGHAVTVFEAQDQVGGTTFMGIPAYRLPRAVIAADVKGITDIGVEIRTGQALGRDFSLQDLRDQGWDAVFLGIGAMRGYLLGIKGESDYPQVLDAVSFLRAVSQGDLQPPAEKVVVVGGGNAAMDAARTCLRLGVDQVVLAYRRTREQMPAHDEEVREAQAEGVEMRFLTIPLAVEGQGGRVTGLRCLRAELGPPDDSGRRRPVPVENSEFVIPAGAVIAAIGQQPDLTCLGDLAGQANLAARTLRAHPLTGQTVLPWLFAGGDAVTGPRTVVEAVAAGKRAAQALDAWLRGQDPVAAVELPRPRQRVDPLLLPAAEKASLGRARIPQRQAQARRRDFDQVELPLPPDGALREAQRCLRCDLCIGCGLCQTACAEAGVGVLQLSPTPADRLAFLDMTGPGAGCIGCGSCANVCPTGALRMLDQGAIRRLALGGAVFAELDLVPCLACGRHYAPRNYLECVEGRLDARHAPVSAACQRLCPECSRARGASHRGGARPLPGRA